MDITIIDQLYSASKELIEYLEQNTQPTFKSRVDNDYKKNLVMSIGSYFEWEIKDAIIQLVSHHTNNNELVSAFLKNKAIARQYHTFFSWDSANANVFFSFFGSDFLSFMKREIEKDPALAVSIKAFLEIGRDRNALAHENFANYPLEKTAEEYYELYKKALFFVRTLPSKFDEYLAIGTVPSQEPV